MKSRLFPVLCLLFLSTTVSYAQFHIGARAGLNECWILGTALDGPDDKVVPHTNFYGGITAGFDFGELATTQLELLYSCKGHTDRTVGPDNMVLSKYNRDIGYLQLPLLAGVQVVDGRLRLMLGPEFGFALFSKVTKGIGDDKTTTTGLDRINPFDFGLAFQLGFMIIDNFGVELRVDGSLTRTFNGEYTSTEFEKKMDDKGRNVGVQIGVCYRFEFNND